MKKLVVLFISILLFSCSNIIDPDNLNPTPEPTQTTSYLFDDELSVGDTVSLCNYNSASITYPSGIIGKIDFAWVPPGSFTMNGSQVVINEGFWMSKYEVTVEQWKAYKDFIHPEDYELLDYDNPLERVSWEECQSFIETFNSVTSSKASLPTEVQWEWAARGATESKGYRYAGSNVLEDVAWFYSNSDNSTHKVGEKLPNELGLFDMTGNVAEWCQDLADDGTSRIVRGGSWQSGVNSLSEYAITERSSQNPAVKNDVTGFRLVLPKDYFTGTMKTSLELSYPRYTTFEGYIFDTTPTFSWQVINGAIGYQIQLNTENTFEPPLFDSGKLTYSPNGEYTLPAENMLLGNATYYWRLRVHDAKGNWTDWSLPVQFDVQQPIPEFLTPSCRILSNTTPVLNWESYDYRDLKKTDSYNSAFEIQIAYNETNLDSAPIIKLSKKETYIESTRYALDRNVSSGETIFWRVRACNEDGVSGVWSKTTSAEVVDIVPINTKTIGLGDKAIDFVYVPAGSFEIGFGDEVNLFTEKYAPAHDVNIIKGYWISKYVVTNAQWKAYVDSNDSNMTIDNLPAHASWDTIQSFITTFNNENNCTASLPTNAQWEWAAKGAMRSNGYLYSGSNNVWEVAWIYRRPLKNINWINKIYQSFSGVQPVGLKLPNELGLYDMSGNTLELCSDWYENYPNTPQVDPTGPNTGTYHVIRSSSYDPDWFIPFYSDSAVYFRSIGNSASFRLVLPAE